MVSGHPTIGNPQKNCPLEFPGATMAHMETCSRTSYSQKNDGTATLTNADSYKAPFFDIFCGVGVTFTHITQAVSLSKAQNT